MTQTGDMKTSAPDPADGALVLFSGGQDSTACLAWALTRFGRAETIGFSYGQRHDVELAARTAVLARLRAQFPQWGARLGPDHVVDLSGYGAMAESALTADREIEMDAAGLPTTFVPGRNLVFLSVAAAQGWRRGLGVLVGGMCETDYSGYPDCRRVTMDAMAQALTLGLGGDVRIETPLMHLTKAQTWALAHELGGDALVRITLDETHSCYRGVRTRHDWGAGCGDCPACDLRARGWAQYRAAESAEGAERAGPGSKAAGS